MGTVKRLRTSLGAARQKLLYGRDNRHIAALAEQERARWIDAARAELPPLPASPDAPEMEVHCTTGEKQMPMAVWCCWSAMRFLPQARLVLHDDGSMTAESKAECAHLFPGLRLVAPEERKAAVDAALHEMPHLKQWMQSYHFGFKFMVQFVAETTTILDLDSDILALADFGELRERIADPACTMAWNVDVAYSYAYPEAHLKEILGDLIGPLPYRLNGGLGLLDLYAPDEWERLEQVLDLLHKNPQTDPLRYWMHQTMQAMIASKRGAGAGPLPTPYDIYYGPLKPGTVMRHFVGNPRTRPRFYTEGVPAVIADARARGQLPANFARAYVPEEGQ